MCYQPAFPMTPMSEGLNTTLTAVDISAYGDERRDDDVQMYLREAMYDLVKDALSVIQLPWRYCYHEDRGDGLLVITPPGIPAEALMDPLAHHLHARLRRRNRLASEVAHMRLRLATHTGQIHHDPHGIGGHAAVHLFRLLDSPAFKAALNASGADLGLIVSDQLFHDARRSGLVDPDAYQPIQATLKETDTRAWVWLPPTNHRTPFRAVT
jgi:hypothetical protein